MNYSDRRDFLKKSSIITATAFLPAIPLWAKGLSQIGIQLYTLRNELDQDVWGTLKQLAPLGYTHVEGYGNSKGHYFGEDPKEFALKLKDIGLCIKSMHIGLGALENPQPGTLRNGFEKLCENAAKIGQSYLIVPNIDKQERVLLDGYKSIADELNKAGSIAQKHGITLGYHNHAFEFDALENVIPYDLMLDRTDPKLVQFEMDLYWVVKAGKDPLDYFNRFSKRFPLWHVKDMDKGPEKTFAEVGSGSINFTKIFKKENTSGMKLFFVEQDKCQRPPLESISMSVAYLKKFKY